MKRKIEFLVKSACFALSIALLLTACASDSDKLARLEVRMTDAPGDYEELNIDIREVQVNNTMQGSGWQSLDITPGIYDILKLTNGLDTLLGAIELPAGKIQQIRLVIGNNNTVKVDGQLYPIKTPSAQQSGLKINLNTTLVEGITYTILLDFDAARSVIEKGNKTYSLKPVIRAIEEATSGVIRGTIAQVELNPVVYAITGLDTLATAYTNQAGKFFMQGIPAGTYTVSVVSSGKPTVNKSNVSVELGGVTDLGTIQIP